MKCNSSGDFRFCPDMREHPWLSGLTIHELFLDTTYCNPRYDFPPQSEVVGFAVEKTLSALSSDPETVIVCGSYTIGKEKVFQGGSQYRYMYLYTVIWEIFDLD